MPPTGIACFPLLLVINENYTCTFTQAHMRPRMQESSCTFKERPGVTPPT